MFGNVTRTGQSYPRVGGRCESDPPGAGPGRNQSSNRTAEASPADKPRLVRPCSCIEECSDASRDTRAAHVQWREHGFGPWAVRDKQGKAFSSAAPSCARRCRIDGIAPDEVEAGWWVTEDRRNDGIATEAMEVAVHHVFSRTDVETITAYIWEWGYEASRRVAAKLGFSVRGRGHGRSGEPMTVYTLPRDDWLRQRP